MRRRFSSKALWCAAASIFSRFSQLRRVEGLPTGLLEQLEEVGDYLTDLARDAEVRESTIRATQPMGEA
jgi:hypothetical protein